jgi:AcrR family transcriptional regulator
MKSAAVQVEPRRYSQTARAQATEETGRRIVEAFLALLMTDWFDEITLDRIAEDAGVTVQTIVRRFGGKEGLLGAVAKALANQINKVRASEPGDVVAMVERLFADYERTGDAVLRMLALELRYPAIHELGELGRREHREWVMRVLPEWLNRMEPAARRRAVDALVVVTDVYTWKLLRRDMGRSVTAAQATMQRLVEAAISEFQKPE